MSVVLRIAGVVLVGALIVAAAGATWLVADDLTDSRPIAWALAAVAFPLGPLLWCVVGEAGRVGGTLTRLDRCTLRTVVLDGLILSGALAFGDPWAAFVEEQSPQSEAAIHVEVTTTVTHTKSSTTTTPKVSAREAQTHQRDASDEPASADDDVLEKQPPPRPDDPLPRKPSPVDASCLDGEYEESIATQRADVDDLIEAYDPDDIDSLVDGVLGRRYPFGLELVKGGRKMTDCVAAFTQGQTETAEDLVAALSTVVHECGHMYDISKTKNPLRSHLFGLADGRLTTCRKRSTFPRSEIREDSFAGDHDDTYAETYLSGASGEQGFAMLVEELVQYIHGLATAHAVADVRGGRFANASMSHRDGVLTFLWYVQRYLYVARTKHPKAHAELLGDECWRNLVLSAWGRAWLFLEATADDPRMGIADTELEARVRTPELLAEIEAVRRAQGC